MNGFHENGSMEKHPSEADYDIGVQGTVPRGASESAKTEAVAEANTASDGYESFTGIRSNGRAKSGRAGGSGTSQHRIGAQIWSKCESFNYGYAQRRRSVSGRTRTRACRRGGRVRSSAAASARWRTMKTRACCACRSSSTWRKCARALSAR